MSLKALIVEDDARVIESIEDALFSMGHEHDWVTNQHDAQHALTANTYDYVLLDLQIPAKGKRGGAEKEFGANLLAHVRERHRLPVIVMTAYTGDCLDLAMELLAKGASDFIAKPFTNSGRTLASVVRRVLRNSSRHKETGRQSPFPSAQKLFQGGEMVFYSDHVELCGVQIMSDRGTGQCMQVLNELRRCNAAGRYIHLSGAELVTAIKAVGGVGTITGCIKRIRDNVAQRLKKELGVTCGRDDVIQNNEQGYSLRDWIVAS